MRLHFPTEAISDMNSLGSRTSSRPARSQITFIFIMMVSRYNGI